MLILVLISNIPFQQGILIHKKNGCRPASFLSKRLQIE